MTNHDHAWRSEQTTAKAPPSSSLSGLSSSACDGVPFPRVMTALRREGRGKKRAIARAPPSRPPYSHDKPCDLLLLLLSFCILRSLAKGIRSISHIAPNM